MLDAIKTELRLRKGEIIDEIKTIYFGGGTPSLLGKNEIQELLDVIGEHYRLGDDPEITLEANPDDLDHNTIKELAESPVNRLSIGIQSFFDKDLKYMNRAHNENQAKESLTLASTYFKNISIDLIYGIPDLSEQRWLENLKQAFDLGVVHISSYALTVEPKTALDHFIKSGKYPPIDESLAKNHFEILQKETSQRGYIQYEISNFGLEGYFSKHNSSYWMGDHYLGAGPSAHSYNGQYRSWNVSNNTKYISSIEKGELPSENEQLSTKDRINESIMTGLRTIWGVSLDEIEKSYGKQYRDKVLGQAQKHLDQKTIKMENGHLLMTSKGIFLADGIAADLFIL